MANTAIVFHSLHGNVRAVARKIAQSAGIDLVELAIPGADRYKGFRMYFCLGFMASAKRRPNIEGGMGKASANLDGYLKLDEKLISVDEIEPGRHGRLMILPRNVLRL